MALLIATHPKQLAKRCQPACDKSRRRFLTGSGTKNIRRRRILVRTYKNFESVIALGGQFFEPLFDGVANLMRELIIFSTGNIPVTIREVTRGRYLDWVSQVLQMIAWRSTTGCRLKMGRAKQVTCDRECGAPASAQAAPAPT
jgi:hypothetical protein